MPSLMQKGILYALPIVVAAVPAVMLAQSPKAATYITDEEVKAVNATPGIDRTIRVVDIGQRKLRRRDHSSRRDRRGSRRRRGRSGGGWRDGPRRCACGRTVR